MNNSFLVLWGKKILNVEKNNVIGRLSDILIKKGSKDIFGIVSTNDGILYKNRIFRLNEIEGEDRKYIYVRGIGERYFKVIPEYECEVKSCRNGMYKSKILTYSGEKLGKVKNIIFDIEAGQLCEFEVGPIKKKRIVLTDRVDIFGDNIFIDDTKNEILNKELIIKNLWKRGSKK